MAIFLGQQKKSQKAKLLLTLGKKALEYLPDVYENLSGKIKNKKLKKIFDSDSAKKLVRYGSSYGQNNFYQSKNFNNIWRLEINHSTNNRSRHRDVQFFKEICQKKRKTAFRDMLGKRKSK